MIRSFDWDNTPLGPLRDWSHGLKFAVRAMLDSPIPISLYIGPSFIRLYNDTFVSTLGGREHPDMFAQPLVADVFAWNFLQPIFAKVMDGEAYTIKDQKWMRHQECYMDLYYTPVYADAGEIIGVQQVLIETTDKVNALHTLQQSEAKFRTLIEEAPIAVFMLMGKELVLEVANESMLNILGKDSSVQGRPIVEVLPEWKGSNFLKSINEVYVTGESWEERSVCSELFRLNKNIVEYYDCSCKPLRRSNGEVYAIICMAVEVTKQVLAQQLLERNQEELLASFEQAPIGIAIIKKENLTFTMANPFSSVMTGRKPEELIGKPLLEALPELAGQGFDTILLNVIESEKPFVAYEVPVQLKRDNKMDTIYSDITYQPRYDSSGKIVGILVICIDVTQQVVARKKIEETQDFLRTAIDLAELGIWSLDLKTKILDYDPRLRSWFGFGDEEVITIERAYDPIQETDRHMVRASMLKAITPGATDMYDVEYHVANEKDGTIRILHALGKPLFDDKQEAYKVIGTVQDVTAIRKIELELTRQVQQRTEELAASNEELRATNEEIEEANNNLQRSNAELEQFAYIASHDLQEPIRKISTFLQMLENNVGEVNDKAKGYFDKINASTSRMTTLIRDVLAYSQLSEVNEQYVRLDLNAVFEDAKADFELLIQQKAAVIKYSGLPIIEAIPLQMSQLFGNLLSNSLKYSKPEVAPEIFLTGELMSFEEIAEYPMLNVSKNYYRMEFKDNGIGIHPEQISRIFNIFQRLHGKEAYAGTGIGLSLCKKIVQNHHGYIDAFSTEGSGTTFRIILPRHFRKNVG